MADADYFLDLSSSPDPLADDIPSSIRPVTRRITKSQHELSSLSIPQSSPRRTLRAQSPRKRTFELDVGDERSPQRIRVTVEAEESLKHNGVNRKLFPSSSPTRGEHHSEAVTTTIPLNDEPEHLEGHVATPQKRGRKRRTSNGTPMPRTRKRAGTPIQRKAKQARHEDEPPSETGMLSDAPTDMGGEQTPKPKAKIRKTPRKQASKTTAVPSSQASSTTTGRKRGRPRKVPIPEETTALAEPQAEKNVTTSSSRRDLRQPNREITSSININTERLPGDIENDHNNTTTSNRPLRRSNEATTSSHISPPQESIGLDRLSGSPASSQQEVAGNDDAMMSDDYQGMEPQSDLGSEDDGDDLRQDREDTVANASDFSMIAIDSLASFQASFLADHGVPASPHEMGAETSRIVNETLDSLRRSIQDETETRLHITNAEDEVPHQSTVVGSNDSSRAFSKSPRRFKSVPLSRQVFVGRGNVDDSFSSIPDSILHAATPVRPSMKPTSAEPYDGDGGAGDDSFSEIPDAILHEATPRPQRRSETPTHKSPTRSKELHHPARPVARRSSADYGSSRLPTPEETSSSNAGSNKQTREDDIEASLEPLDKPEVVQRTEVTSSPPARNRPRALDIEYSNLQHDPDIVQDRRSSSPQLQSLSKHSTNQIQLLEAPLPTRRPSLSRPSLSPIVRVGRTLQNVMTDNSSPDRREESLGSPFRGPANGEQQRQSSVSRSLSPSIRYRATYKAQPPSGSPSRIERGSRSTTDRSYGRYPRNSGDVEDLSGPGNSRHSNMESLRDSAGRQPSNPAITHNDPSINSFTRINPTSDDAAGRDIHGYNPRQRSRQQSSFRTMSSDGQSTAGPRGGSASHEAPAHGAQLNSENDNGRSYQSVQDMDEERREEPIHDMEYDRNDEVNDYEDDFDVWDIEASRASPDKTELEPEPAQTTLQFSKPDLSQPRRNKNTSPWRRNNRRLIYQDEIASSSQIEIEDSPESELEQDPPIESRSQSPEPPPQRITQRGTIEPLLTSPPQEKVARRQNTASPIPSHDSFREYAGREDSEGPDDDMSVRHQQGSPQLPWEQEIPEEALALGPQEHEELEAHDEYEEQEAQADIGMPAAQKAPVDVSEYSMLAQQSKPTPKPKDKATSSKSRFLGGFDILSFFSSPVTLPQKNPSDSRPEPVNKPEIFQPTTEARLPKEPPKALWSTGLFPSIPQKESSLRPERKTDMFPPAPALHSNDTIPDNYDEPSTSVPPSLSRSPATSVAPSTPERQVFAPIEQKQNFTPRPGQSKGSLFTRSRETSVAAQSEVDDDDDVTQELNDEHESSRLTEGSEYERVPPREKPSRWDRNLSPTKSCFRSPLKPTTPGRLVAFTHYGSSPVAQAQERSALRTTSNAKNAISQAPPPLRPTFHFQGKDNQRHPHTRPLESTLVNHSTSSNGTNSKSSTVLQHDTGHHEPPAAARPASFLLSQTTWTKHHWARLDEILQLRRHNPMLFEQMCSLPPSDERLSWGLLGKEVAAQDSSLVLEAWHLEVVEAFKLEVGGWDEQVLAKRLFALVIGEEKRRAGVVPASG